MSRTKNRSRKATDAFVAAASEIDFENKLYQESLHALRKLNEFVFVPNFKVVKMLEEQGYKYMEANGTYMVHRP